MACKTFAACAAVSMPGPSKSTLKCRVIASISDSEPYGVADAFPVMNEDLQKRIAEALRNPQNLGELPDADAIGTVGNSDCGEMLRMWVKFKEQNGKRVIDRATFQSFGCETAIAVASLATELIRGKTAEEALSLKTEELSGELGPLPPMKIHCAQLVEGALRSALAPEPPAMESPQKTPDSSGTTLLDSFAKPKQAPPKITFLDKSAPDARPS
jgi:nitrogen fixation NifU-like protein